MVKSSNLSLITLHSYHHLLSPEAARLLWPHCRGADHGWPRDQGPGLWHPQGPHQPLDRDHQHLGRHHHHVQVRIINLHSCILHDLEVVFEITISFQYISNFNTVSLIAHIFCTNLFVFCLNVTEVLLQTRASEVLWPGPGVGGPGVPALWPAVPHHHPRNLRLPLRRDRGQALPRPYWGSSRAARVWDGN